MTPYTMAEINNAATQRVSWVYTDSHALRDQIWFTCTQYGNAEYVCLSPNVFALIEAFQLPLTLVVDDHADAEYFRVGFSDPTEHPNEADLCYVPVAGVPPKESMVVGDIPTPVYDEEVHAQITPYDEEYIAQPLPSSGPPKPILQPVETGEWVDITHEIWREYYFGPRGTTRIESPAKLLVKKSLDGYSHRIVTTGGRSHYIPAGWIHLEWQVFSGKEPFTY